MIRKIIANDIKDALIRAKYEFGPDVIIIDQKEVKIGKWWNPFKKKKIEVTIAIEDKVKKKEEVIKTQEITRSKDIEEIKKPVILPVVQDSLSKEDGRLEYEIDPLFEHAGEGIKSKLVSYCKLHNKENYMLSRKEREEFLSIILRDSPFQEKLALSKINVLVGPTGVGKTTTIAKIAASQQLGNNKKIGLITMDNYRIGAIEQLRTYSEILSVPFKVVNNPSEMEESIEKMKDCDIILIDTLGSSPRDMKKLIEIKKNLNIVGEELNTYLVMSASTDQDSMKSIIERYKMLKYEALILTKIDELENMKNLWYLIEGNLVPIQYFCHGQSVPEDIKEATPETIFKYFEESFANDRSS